MRICYVLLSPTFGMHQYTADLANRMVEAGHAVTLVTTTHLPRDRYSPQVRIQTPVRCRTTGIEPDSLLLHRLRVIARAVMSGQPDVVHFTGPHLWNVLLVRHLRRGGLRVVHTIHDLEPHEGVRLGRLLQMWNRAVWAVADDILVHGHRYRERMLAAGLAPEHVWYTPLLHLFLSYEATRSVQDGSTPKPQPIVDPYALFFGRLEAYKGLRWLLAAFATLDRTSLPIKRLILAGPGGLDGLWGDNLPAGVEVRNRFVSDEEALDLFRNCSLLVLPYTSATQSALVAAAYFFAKPVLVTRSGALAESVQPDRTGFIVEAEHTGGLASALADALGDPARLRHMGLAGRAWYEQQQRLESATLQRLYGEPAGETWYNGLTER